MPTPRLAPELERSVIALLRQGGTLRSISEQSGVSIGKIHAIKTQITKYGLQPGLQDTKKVGEFDIDEWFDWMETGQALKKKASWSQDTAKITLGDGKTPQILFQLGDTHIASWGTNHKLMRNAISEIRDTPNLHVALMGDLIQMSIKMRSVLEVSDNMLPPEQQCMMLEKVLEKIIDKVAFSTWCNHGVEREEKQSGVSMVKAILSRKTVYFNGIGHPDVHVGKEVYKFAASHKYRGNSMYDSTFGPKRYARMEANDREIILQADLHRPAVSHYVEGGAERLAITNGSFQTGSGYAARYFTLKTWPIMPCVVLFPDRHEFVGCWNLAQAIRMAGK